MSAPQPFHVDTPQADLDDLAARLALARWTEFERGGHFAALLAPDLLERDLREFFAGLR